MADSRPENSPLPIRARLLGTVDLRVGDRILTSDAWRRRSARHILLMLLGTAGHRLPRDAVLDALWPNHDLEFGLNSLYKSMHVLRRTLEPGLRAGAKSAYVHIGNDWVTLLPHDGMWVDIDGFEYLIRQAEVVPEPREALHAALDLYRGEFVADEPYLDWPVARRVEMRSVREHAVLHLARLDLEWGYPLATLGHLQALLADDPACEEAHRAMIRALLARGQRASALQQFEQCCHALRRELGVVPDPETEALAEMARTAPAPSPNVVSGEVGVPVFNLPGLPTATVGRDRAVVAVREMLATSDTRLVTIVGTGGVGKTRLAIEIGRGAGTRFPDGVAFVALDVIRDPVLFYPAIAGVLRVSASLGQRLVDTVHDALRRRTRFLLVLDNLEHLPDVAVRVADLLAAVPSLTVLATSREPLRIRAERLYRLEPLAVPDSDPMPGGRALEDVDSVALFLRCVRAWGSEDVPITGDSLLAVAAVCRRLDGLPLAIELAAARARDARPASILAQLDDRFANLRDGPRDLPERHRGLYATISWSYDLLPTAERRLFRGLAVFAGGIETDALATMFGPAAIPMAQTLADKSLLRQERADDGVRLVMPGPIRGFAAELLERHGERVDRLRAHAKFFQDLAVRSGLDPARRGSTQIAWLRRLERDQDNIHLALATGLDLGDADTALAITSAMGRFWDTHLAAPEACSWIGRSLALTPEGVSRSAGWSALWGVSFAWRTSDQEATIAFENEARRIWTELGSSCGLAWVDYHVAERLGFEGRYEEMRAIHAANLAVFRCDGDTDGVVLSLIGMSDALGMTGTPQASVDALREALDVARAADNLILQSFVMGRLPVAMLAAGDTTGAATMAVEGERLARRIGDRQSLPWAVVVQASLAYERGDLETALAQARTALTGFQDAGDVKREWIALMVSTLILVASGRLDDARAYALATGRNALECHGDACKATVLPEIAGCLLALGYPDEALIAYAAGLSRDRVRVAALPSDSGQRYEAGMRRARDLLTEVEAESAWQRGQRESLDDILALLRDCLVVSRV